MNEGFSRRLRLLRESQHISRTAVATRCLLPQDSIRRYERGEAMPSVESLISIADYFHVSLDYLLGRTNY